MFEALRIFGRTLFDYYLDLYDEGDIFFLIINKEILDHCCKKAEITVTDLEDNLRSTVSYTSDDPNVCISIAAYQVYLYSEARKKDNSDVAFNTLETRLIEFYRVRNVAALYGIFNQGGRNYQLNIWVKVQEYLIAKKRYLVIDNSRHNQHIYLKYPETQLDFLITAKYDLELICRNYNVSYASSYEFVDEVIKSHFKRILNSSRNIKRSASPNRREISQINLLKSISLFTFVYSRMNTNNARDTEPLRDVQVQNNNYEFAFEYDSYSDNYNLCVLEHGLYVFSSDENKKWKLLTEQLINDSVSGCGVFEKDEYGYIYDEAPDDSTFENDFIFVSKMNERDFIDYMVNTSSIDFYVYKIPKGAFNLENIISIIKDKVFGISEDDEGTTIDESYVSKFLGGIKIGKNWLLGCEPKVPVNCANIVFDQEKGKTYYPIIENKIIPLTIIDRNNPDKISVEGNNKGWHIYNSEKAQFPNINEYNVVTEEIKPVESNPVQTILFRDKPFKNDRFIGEFNGFTIVVKKSYMPAQTKPVSMEDNYILKDFEKQLLKSIKIIPDRQLFIGDEVTFTIKSNTDCSLFKAIVEEDSIRNRKVYEGYFDGKKAVITGDTNHFGDRFIKINKQLPVGTTFSFSVLYDNENADTLLAVINSETIRYPYNEKAEKFGYRKYTKNASITPEYFDVIDGFPKNVFINIPLRTIEASAVHEGAYYISCSAEKNLKEDKKLNIFIDRASKDSRNLFFIVIKYKTQISELIKNPILPENIFADNIMIFFVKQESKSDGGLELENEDLECQFSDNKDKEIGKKQQQLLWWIEYEGFVTWDSVRKKCNKLIESDEENIREVYEKYGAIYQIFYPLIISGKVEVCKYKFFNSEVFGFSISENWKTEDVSQDEMTKKADYLLSLFPTISSIINGWNDSYNIYSDSEVFPILNTRNGYMFAQNTGRVDKLVEKYNSIIFKIKREIAPYIPRNIAWKDIENDFIIMKEIPIKNYCDANFYVNCFIECKKNQDIFEYSKEKRELKCNKALPVLLQRALLMYDMDRLSDTTHISGSRWKDPYKNISPEIVSQLNRIFEIKIKEV